MCGISGIVSKSGLPVSEADLSKMNDLIHHRGPDAGGYFFGPGFGFGHRRLSILDLSELGNQPMVFNDLCITFNGEIYNYLEIRDELQKKGYEFTTETDTEVILASYSEWGEKCVNRFNGMWAFAIHDKENDKIFISRDRFGIKPVHFISNDDGLYFGSEIKQLLGFIDTPRVNRQILFDYIFLTYHHHSNETFFDEIKCLPPGHNLVYDLKNHSQQITKYYELKIDDRYKNLSFFRGSSRLRKEN